MSFICCSTIYAPGWTLIFQMVVWENILWPEWNGYLRSNPAIQEWLKCKLGANLLWVQSELIVHYKIWWEIGNSTWIWLESSMNPMWSQIVMGIPCESNSNPVWSGIIVNILEICKSNMRPVWIICELNVLVIVVNPMQYN